MSRGYSKEDARAESCLYRPVSGVVSQQMTLQDSQGRKLLYIVSTVAHLPITGVEGHYHAPQGERYQSRTPTYGQSAQAEKTPAPLPTTALYGGAHARLDQRHF